MPGNRVTDPEFWACERAVWQACRVGLKLLPRVTPLHLAQVCLPEGHPAATFGSSVPVYGFAIGHPGGTILVDTGVGHGSAVIDDLYQPERTELDECLDRLGIDIDNVIAVVNSHPAEIDAVNADPYYTVADWAIAPTSQQHVVSGDEQIVEGVSILATPGHTAGHQSVLVEGGGRRVIIGAQVVWHHSELTAETASRANVDPDPDLERAAVDSMRRLKALGPEIIHLSHCDAYRPSAV